MATEGEIIPRPDKNRVEKRYYGPVHSVFVATKGTDMVVDHSPEAGLDLLLEQINSDTVTSVPIASLSIAREYGIRRLLRSRPSASILIPLINARAATTGAKLHDIGL